MYQTIDFDQAKPAFLTNPKRISRNSSPVSHSKSMEYRIAVLLFVLVWSSGDAQQVYNEQDQLGYSCAAGGSAQCQAYAAYRALARDTLNLVGQRFGLSEEQVATASDLRSTTEQQQLATGQWLLIPLNCSCVSGRSQYNTSYIIQQDDTYFLVSTSTFQGLTTDDAVGRANPSFQANKLQPGDKIIFPIRCSCPARNQTSAGVKALLTYPVAQGDSLGAISGAWNVSQEEIQSENRGVLDRNLQATSTLLLPITTEDPPQLPKQPSVVPATPPSAPPVASADGDDDDGSSKTGTYVGIAVGASAAVVLAVLAGICWRRRKSELMPEDGSSKNGLVSDAFNSNEQQQGKQQQGKQQKEFLAGMADLVDSEKPIMFSYEELRVATDGFSPSHLLQGSVYRGLLRDELLAIKKMKGGTTSKELKILWKVHHSNLVKLVGMCSKADQLFLVYEYAENGSLSSCLHTGNKSANPKIASSSSAYLSWNTRLQIALDVAAGLEYIHDYTKPGFVHKDIKSSNILLESDFRAKIANFGLARLAENSTAPALTKHIAGTQGYMAPEYLAHGFISTKVDVYAFGVVLLELLTGREPILSNSSDSKETDLAQIIVKLMDESGESGREHKIERVRAWVDPVLENAVAWDCALRFALLARSCVDDDPRARPSMKEATFALSKMLESSLQWETAAVLERQQKSTSMEGR